MPRNRNLPQVVQQALDHTKSQREDRLAAISEIVVTKRNEAVTARKSSGIEEVWARAEDAYVGIDDLNRGEFQNAKWIKPTSPSGPVTTAGRRGTQDEVRSTVFIPMTSRYVDAGSAKLGEILIPIDDKPFSFDATPVPDLVNGKDDTRQVTSDAGDPLMRNPKPEELAALQQPGAAPVDPEAGVPITVKDLAQESIDMAKASAKKAETRIYDWMVESKHPAEMRKVIFDGARIGVGVLKAPFPERRTSQAVSKEGGIVKLQMVSKIAPASKSISPWNCFPDRACGENIQNGDYFLERDFLSPKQVKDLKALPGYIAAQIEKVLTEGPGKQTSDDNNNNQDATRNEHRFPVWYFYGTLSRQDMETMVSAGGLKPESLLPEGDGDCYAIVTLINDTAVRATVNPLDSGKFPYHAFPWRRREGHWAGVGVGEQLNTPQRMINAASRRLLGNAGKSAGFQTVVDRGSVTPADGTWVITDEKLWYKNADATVDDVRKAFATFQFPNMGPQLMAIIDYAFKLAEEATSIPLITQGQSGPTTPETYGAAQLQNSNANQLLRSIGYTVDDFITEPVVNQYYEWLLLDPDVPNEEKGDWQINAHGSAALVERAIQDQTIAQMAGMVKDPAFGFNPKLWAKEMMKSKRLDPRSFQYTEEEQAKIESQPQPKAPAVEAATIRAQSAEKIAQTKSQENVELAKQDTDRDTAYNESLARRDEIARQKAIDDHDRAMQLETLKYANLRQISIDEAKVQLAQTVMKLDTQKDLTLAGMTVDVHKHHKPSPQVATPAVEPVGRAPAGEAFIK